MNEEKIYVAGPMTGYENYNFDAFDDACDRLKRYGFHPVSPANIDRCFEGWGKYPPEGAKFTRDDLVRFMDRDLNALRGCQHIYLLQGWDHSKGALVELAYAEFLGLEVHYEEEGAFG